MAESHDLNTLKRRGRRRLVGAIALVLLAVIVLPMVFDSEPGQGVPPVSVRIPSEDTSFSPAVPSKPPAAAPAPQSRAQPHEEREKPVATTKKPSAAPRAGDAERARAEAALANVEYIVPVAALASREKVKELTDRLAAAKLPYYTEPIATASGPVTRVRAGPFVSREAAERALLKLKGLGLKPGNITTKSG
jgi:DedD protein